MVAEIDIVVRLVVAVILGVVVGIERDMSRKPFGMRDAALISMATALFAIMMSDMASEDLARLLPAIVTGVGFLGAGVIIKVGVHVHGMTTAAMLWVLVGIGYGVGAGMLFAPVVATFLVLGVLLLKYRYRKLE
ncbi:MAG: MgtC/SapB family protein [Candidatus Aenigmarchaeota archaeon]|nr:MgtC/SapB family protein [Candidatus Aenigmarchaeota archaeon]